MIVGKSSATGYRQIVLLVIFAHSVCTFRQTNPVSTDTTEADDTDHNCHLPLGVANNGLIPLYWLFASDGFAYRGRLNKQYSWISDRDLYPDAEAKDPKYYAWIQVDLRRPTLVTGIQTQGDPTEENWVTWFYIYHSDNCEIFYPLIDAESYITRFLGNTDQNTTATSLFAEPVVTRCIRVVPIKRHGNNTALRMELLGCDARMCREAIITHMQEEKIITDQHTLSAITNDLLHSDVSINTTSPHKKVTPFHEQSRILINPTLITQGYVEFKFHAEQIVMGMVVYSGGKQDETPSSVMVTFSRNCHKWQAVRETKHIGDPFTFRTRFGRYRRSWHTFPYPVRAQCIRVIPLTTRYSAKPIPIQAHFLGCGTGPGVLETCGMQKVSRRRHKRVIGGSLSSPGEWPWLVSIHIREAVDKDFYHVCGASLIHPQWLITAVHCVSVMYHRMFQNITENFRDFNQDHFLTNIRVHLGKYSLTVYEDTDIVTQIEKIIIHPNFNWTNYVHDMALVKLTQSVRLSDHVGLICLPPDDHLFLNNTSCHTVGWGRTSNGFPSRPHKISVNLFTFDECQNIFAHLNLTRDMMCAGHLDGTKDACFGDSGGPLVCEHDGRWYQLGLVSWNIGCAFKGYPGVYSSIPRHLQWMESILLQDRLGIIVDNSEHDSKEDVEISVDTTTIETDGENTDTTKDQNPVSVQ